MGKILFFLSTTRIGGAETNVLKIANELAKRGHEIHFAALKDDGPLIFYVDFILSSFTVIGDYKRHPICSIKTFRGLLLKHNFDVVSNFGFRVEFFSRIISHIYHVKRIVSNIRSIDSDKSQLKILLDKLTSPFVSVWVSNSEAAKSVYTHREGFLSDKIEVIYNFVDVESGLPIDKEFNFNIGVLANIKECKGHFDLIAVCNTLLKNNVIPQFYLGGVDNMKGMFHSIVIENGLERYFTFQGFINDKEAFFEQLDVFLLPSYMEGMPTVILEAMKYSIPVVASNVGGIPEQITNGFNGFICNPGDSGKYAENIMLLKDEELRKSIILHSHEYLFDKFAKNKCIDKWEKLFFCGEL